jgi:phosphotransferase system  glucose/maltose/N-acetylglucosamine-specific IIC component
VPSGLGDRQRLAKFFRGFVLPMILLGVLGVLGLFDVVGMSTFVAVGLTGCGAAALILFCIEVATTLSRRSRSAQSPL